MKTLSRLFILWITFISITTLTGCNNSQEASTTTPTDTQVIDRDVTTNVKTALQLDEKVRGFDITVITLKGDVKLIGIVNNQSEIDQAVKITRSVDGVHSIHNELSISK